MCSTVLEPAKAAPKSTSGAPKSVGTTERAICGRYLKNCQKRTGAAAIANVKGAIKRQIPPYVATKQQGAANDFDTVASLDRIRPSFERFLDGPARIVRRCRYDDDVRAAPLQELRDFTCVTADAGEFGRVVHTEYENFNAQAIPPQDRGARGKADASRDPKLRSLHARNELIATVIAGNWLRDGDDTSPQRRQRWLQTRSFYRY